MRTRCIEPVRPSLDAIIQNHQFLASLAPPQIRSRGHDVHILSIVARSMQYHFDWSKLSA